MLFIVPVAMNRLKTRGGATVVRGIVPLPDGPDLHYNRSFQFGRDFARSEVRSALAGHGLRAELPSTGAIGWMSSYGGSKTQRQCQGSP